MINLIGKKVLITGGSGGIGAACVKLFADAGADVVFTYNSGASAAERLKKYSGTGLLEAVKADIASEKDIKKSAAEAAALLGRIDILVNNAGIWKHGRAAKMSLKDWDETIRINLTGTFLFTREVLPGMIKRKEGKIINISSTAGQRGESEHSHYAASKGGIISYTKSLASELGRYNINVNCVAPGWVITGMTKTALSGSKGRKAADVIPLKRIATPEDIAGPVLFLASGLSSHITGEILNVNGGSVLCG